MNQPRVAVVGKDGSDKPRRDSGAHILGRSNRHVLAHDCDSLHGLSISFRLGFRPRHAHTTAERGVECGGGANPGLG